MKMTNLATLRTVTANADAVLRGFGIPQDHIDHLVQVARRTLANSIPQEFNFLAELVPSQRTRVESEVLAELKLAIEDSIDDAAFYLDAKVSTRMLADRIVGTAWETVRAQRIGEALATSLRLVAKQQRRKSTE